jgi:hypothetical protein
MPPEIRRILATIFFAVSLLCLMFDWWVVFTVMCTCQLLLFLQDWFFDKRNRKNE